MTHPTDDEIMELAGSWFHTGENQKRDDGYYYRSLGTPSNVRGSDLIEFARALLAEQARTEPDLAPGVMRCARCKFRLHRINLNVNVGTVTAGDNKTEPCPNGCGPLWPVTWKEEAEEAMAVAEGLCDRAVAAEKELADLRERLGPRAAPPVDTGARVKLGDITASIAPLSITADGLAALGFKQEPSTGAAKLYKLTDLPAMYAAMVAHIEAVQAKQAA